MNKIFKVIWNHAAQRFVVTSELTKSNGKSSSSTDNRIEPSKALLAISVAGAALLGSASAMAATVVADASQPLKDSTNTILKSGGQELYIVTNNNQNAIAIGGASSGTSGVPSAQAVVGGTAIGAGTYAGEGSIAISYKANASGGNAISIGYTSAATGGASIAMGLATSASGLESVAIGRGAKSSGKQSTAFGSLVNASGEYSVAMGMQASATGAQSTAIGQMAAASAAGSIVIGTSAGILPGFGPLSGVSSVAIGQTSLAAGERAVALGRTATANGARSTALGAGAVVEAEYGVAVGNRAQVSAAGAINGVAVGNSSNVSSAYSVAVGPSNTVTGTGTSVLGSNITATANNNVILGQNSSESSTTTTTGVAKTVNTATVGAITYNGFQGVGSGIVSVGGQNAERQIINVAPGNISATSTDAINGSQLYMVAAEVAKGFNVTNAAGDKTGNILPGKQIQFTNGDLTTSSVTPQVDGDVAVTFNVDKGRFNAPTDGTLAPNPADTGVATVTDVADAVNAGYWKVGNLTDVVNNVHFGDDVRFTNGTNTTVTVKQNGVRRTDVTIDTDFAKLPTENTTTANITNNAGTIKVDVNTGKGAYAADGTVNDNNNGDKIANISSVVELVSNAGWNIYQETTADKKDLVVAGDNIVFAKGANTTVSVETDATGKTTTVKYDVDLSNVNSAVANTTLSVADGKVETPAEGDKLVNATTVANAINGSGWQTTLTDGTAETINPGDKVNYVNGTTTIADVTKDGAGNVNVKFEVNKAALTQDIKPENGKAALDGTTTNADNFVTAGDVINTINNVYWVATSDTDGGSFATAAAGHAKSNAEVKAGNTVTFKAGKGLSIKQDGTNFTYAVATGGLSSDTDVNNIGTTLGKANANEADGTIATVGDVANAINHAGWVTQTSTGDTVVINPGDVVNYVNGKNTTANITANAKGGVDVSFDVDLPDTKVNGDAVSGDINFVNGKTTTVTNDKGKIKVEVNTGDSSVENGKAKSTTDDDAAKVATVGDIVDTINKVYHSVNSTTVTGSTGQSTYTKNEDSQINAGDTVNYNAGNNIKIGGSGNTIEISTTENVTFTNANVTSNLKVDGDTTVNNFTVKPGANIDMGGNIISNVLSGIAPTDAVNVKQLQDAIGNATSSLVWKVTDNNNAANVTNVGNQTTVSFNNGEGTSAIVDGTNVAYNVNVDGTSTQITYVDANGNTLVKNADGSYTNIKDGSTVTSPTIKGSQVSVAFGDVSANSTTGVVSSPDTTTKAASTQDVANAINGSGFTLTTSNSSTGAVSGTTSELINPGETITIDAGNNINITQSGNKVSVATSMTPTFTTVQVGGNSGPVMSGDANGDVKVAKADGSAAKITNVAPGEVSRTSTDAVNGSQLYAVANGIDNKFGDIHNKINRNNKDLRAGVAGANAAAALPQVFKSGRSMVAASAGTFKGQSAVAVGYSRASDNGKLILKLQGNANSRGDVGGGVGVGYQW